MQNTKLLDVARHARVSPATVSRVLNKSAPVNGSTRTRVLEAIVALGYKPTSIPRLNATDQGTIALVITDILNPFFAEIVQVVRN
jgi:LacI family transcriptional regulator